MTPEWFALIGLFVMVVAQDYRQDYERAKRHLYHWVAFTVIGLVMFLIGAAQAAFR